MMYPIYLEWTHCPDGVELLEADEQADEAEIRIGAADQRRYRPKSDARAPVVLSSVDLTNPVVLHFLNAAPPTWSGFLGRFGMLDQRRHVTIDQMVKHHEEVSRATNEMLSDEIVRADAATSLLKAVRLTASFDLFGPNEKPTLRLQPATLLQFMAVEVAVAAVNDVKLASCGNCGRMFFTGPLTKRRSRAEYCKDVCRVDAMRKRNAAAARAPAETG